MSAWALNKSPQMGASLQLSHFLTRPEIMAATANVATQQLYIDNLICMGAAVRLRLR